MKRKEKSENEMSIITPKNICRHELIGLNVKVAGSTSKSYIGIFGKVINETKNMLTIHSKGNEKHIPKSISKFCFTLYDGKKVEVFGKNLIGRPEDRVRKILRRW